MLKDNSQGVRVLKDENDEDLFEFSLFSSSALSVSLVVFDADSGVIKTESALAKNAEDIWQVHIGNIAWGDYYGFKVECGHPKTYRYYNTDKLLLDPYAKQLEVTEGYGDLPEIVCRLVKEETGLRPSKPIVPWEETVVYEVHVKGFSKLNHRLDEHLQGKYLGLSHPLSIAHFKKLGVTTVELMPCQAMIDEVHLTKNGLTNYWGYNPVSFFALTNRYANGTSPIAEFKQMVDELHEAGLEVIIDLVLNHTAEGNLNGPVVSLKGVDSSTYYLLDQDVEELFINFTGCGNTLNAAHPQVIRLWLDSLRYWYSDLGVDGFRFDLGVTLGRDFAQFIPLHPFLVSINQDPILKNAKIIYEPWDLGPNGYQLGNFPKGSAEWNGHYRDIVRRFIRGDGGKLQEFCTQFVSDNDAFFQTKSRKTSSINFVTAHDGFTLMDLVCFESKHNDENLENNQDGCHHNFSRNYGEEGLSNKQELIAIRTRQRKNFFTTLLLSKGVPMILMGDEIGRTQKGNNNAYCLDNETSWLNWKVNPENDLIDYCRSLIKLRSELAWIHQSETVISWFRPDGKPMEISDWEKWYARSVACRFQHAQQGSVFIVFNMHDGDIAYHLPNDMAGELIWSTAATIEAGSTRKTLTRFLAAAHSISILRLASSH